jgi:hypothetical protein
MERCSIQSSSLDVALVILAQDAKPGILTYIIHIIFCSVELADWICVIMCVILASMNLFHLSKKRQHFDCDVQ